MTDSIQVEDLRHWRALASTNDRMTYHVGLLMADRLINRVLNERANLAWRMMREGQVILVQRKTPNGDTHYEAVAINQQHRPIVNRLHPKSNRSQSFALIRARMAETASQPASRLIILWIFAFNEHDKLHNPSAKKLQATFEAGRRGC
jgi:hypothetical protein